MTTQPSLESFIPLVLQRDRSATVQFGERISFLAWHYLGTWRFSDSEKRDLAVTAATTVMLKLATYRGPRFKAWVKRIVINLARARYAQITGEKVDSMDADTYVPGAEINLFCGCPHPEAQASIQRAIEQLPETDIVILDGRYGDPTLEFQEIADSLQMKCNTVIKRHARALAALRKILADDPAIQQWRAR